MTKAEFIREEVEHAIPCYVFEHIYTGDFDRAVRMASRLLFHSQIPMPKHVHTFRITHSEHENGIVFVMQSGEGEKYVHHMPRFDISAISATVHRII